MTYNIFDGAESRLNEVLQVITKVSPDILIINEANDFDKNNYKKLRYLADNANLPYYHLEQCGDGWNYHVAILSRTPLVSVKPIKKVRRAIIVAEVILDGLNICVVALHLSPFTEEERVSEITKLIPNISDTLNLVIAGDFNSLSSLDGYDSEMIKKLNEGQLKKFTKNNELQYKVNDMLSEIKLVDAASLSNDLSPTVPTKILGDIAHTPVRIDRILMSQDMASRQTSYFVINDDLADTASDHYPVVADFIL